MRLHFTAHCSQRATGSLFHPLKQRWLTTSADTVKCAAAEQGNQSDEINQMIECSAS